MSLAPPDRHTMPDLESPVLLVCLDGWTDAGKVHERLTKAVLGGPTVLVAEFDIDLLVNYRQRRPTVYIEDGINVGIDWPGISLVAIKDAESRDVLVLTGIEPDRGWRGFSAQVLDLAEELKVRMMVTLGAYPAATPHTREVQLSAIGTTPALLEKVGYLQGRVETQAGAHAALERACADRRVPSVGLWAPVPHYAAAESFPPAVIALLDGFHAVADRHFDVDALITESASLLDRLDLMQAGDADRAQLVGELESHADSVATVRGTELPTGEQLAEQFKVFLDGDDA